MYYAIRVGAGVKNKIVESWEECKRLVYNYPAVYKKFKTREQAERYLELTDREVIQLQQIKKTNRDSSKAAILTELRF